mgnify:CR=1 FL=1
MMDKELAQKLKDAVWIGRSLFERNKTAGSSANMSFFHDGSTSARAEAALEP